MKPELPQKKPVSELLTHRRRPRTIQLLGYTMLWTVVGMFCYEAAREALQPGRTSWMFHAATIVVGGIVATLAAYLAYRAHDRARKRYEQMVVEHEKAEASLHRAQHELASRTQDYSEQLSNISQALDLDIEQRQRLETALRESESRFRELTDLLPVMVFELDTQGRLTFVNRTALETFGYSEEAIEHGLSIIELVAESDRERIAGNLVRIMRGEPREGLPEYRARRKDGSEFEMTVVSAPILQGDRWIGARGFAIDLTDRRKAEAEQREHLVFLQRLVDAIPSAVAYKDLDGRYRICNQAFAYLAGRPGSEIIGKTAHEVAPPDVADYYERLDREILAGSDSAVSRAQYHETSFGGRWFVCHKAADRDQNGDPRGIITVFVDVSESKLVENELRRSHELLRRLIATAPLPIISLDAQACVADLWNPAAENMFGWPIGKVQGRLLPIVSARQREEFNELLQKLQQGRHLDGVEAELDRWDGGSVSCSMYATPTRDPDGNVTGSILMLVDLTEAKRVEAALRESEERFRSLADTAPVLMWMAGVHRHCFYFNRMWLQFSGRSIRTEYGKGWLGGVHPEDRESVLNVYDHAFDARRPFMTEFRLLHSDNTYHWVLDRGVPRTTPDGKFTGFIGTCTDITDLKRAEEALRESEERFRAIFLAARDPIFIKDCNRRYVHVNPATEHSFKRPAGRILGQLDEDLSAPEIAAQTRQEDQRVLAGETIESELSEVVDGTRVTHHVVKVPLCDRTGRITGICGIARDITDRKRAEAALLKSEDKFRCIVENLNDVVMLTRPDGKISYLSPSCERILGYKPEDLVGKQPWIIHPDDLEKVQNAHRQALRGKRESEFEYRVQTKTGETKLVSHSWVPILKGDQVQLIVSVITDVTDRRRAETALAEERQLFIAGPTVVYKWHPREDHSIQADYVSPNVRDVFGCAPEDVISGAVQWLGSIHPDDRERAEAETMEAIENGVPVWHQQYRLRHADGSYRWIHDTTVANCDANGVITHFSGYMLDVTAQHESERTLQEERRLFVAGPVVVFRWRVTPDGVKTDYVSPNVERIFGGQPDDFISGRVDVCSLIHPDDLARVVEVKSRCLASLVTHFDLEYRIRGGNGHWRWIREYSVIHHDQTGSVQYVNSYCLDVTDPLRVRQLLRESERCYRMLAERTKEILWTADANLRFTYINHNVQDALGYTPEEICRLTIKDILTPDSFRQSLELLAEARRCFKAGLADENSSWNLQVELVGKDGSLQRADVTCGAVADQHGEITKIVGITTLTQTSSPDRPAVSGRAVPHHELEHLYHEMEDRVESIRRISHHEVGP
ncbi:PAS domain S-box protein [bacterium]|nr:PAS domain S-box protein [bacterium]